RDAVAVSIAAHGLNAHVVIDGEAPRTVVQIAEPPGAQGLVARSLVQQELAKRGVLFNGNNFICLAHSDEDLDQAADAYDAALARLADGLSDGARGVAALLEGPPVSPAFRPVG
ncbi:MAG: hypothetical protein H0W96_03625, partial [Solirubrobacterales bacterium]|nr:hypothetical protein [Solirubrobacterales bacterium]